MPYAVILIIILVVAFAYYKQTQLEYVIIPVETVRDLQKKNGTLQGRVIATEKLVSKLQGLSGPQTFRVDLESIANPLIFPLNIARHMRGHNINYPAINLQIKKDVIDNLQGKSGPHEMIIMIPSHIVTAVQNKSDEQIITLLPNV